MCSEVCPWGQRAPDRTEVLGTHPAVEGATLADWIRLPPDGFSDRFRGSPLQRTHREGLARNAAIAAGHRPSEGTRAALEGALEGDASGMVREAASWALARAHGGEPAVRGLLERAAARESDPELQAALARARAACR